MESPPDENIFQPRGECIPAKRRIYSSQKGNIFQPIGEYSPAKQIIDSSQEEKRYQPRGDYVPGHRRNITAKRRIFSK